MRVAVACGGTGGHIFPGLAVAQVLKGRGHEVQLWLAGRDVEQASVKGWDGPVVFVKAKGFQSSFTPGAVSAAVQLVRAVLISRRHMKTWRPDVVVAMGSYASVGPVLAARSLHIPTVLHEANAVPGRAVAFLSRFADAVAVGFQEAAAYLKSAEVVVTGFPIRGDLDDRFAAGVVQPGMFTVLVMGGSQGAHRLNEVATEAICSLHRRGVPLQVVHLSGLADEAAVRAAYATAGVPCAVFGFLREMGRAYAAADLAISRAGAASCAELQACGVPALLVPLPSARRDHQTHNARVTQASGAADWMPQSDLTPERLAAYIDGCRTDAAKLDAMRAAARARAMPDAAALIANVVEEKA